GRWFLPLTGPAACPVLARDPWLAGAGGAWPWGGGDRGWAGQAAQAGGTGGGSEKVIPPAFWGPPAGRGHGEWAPPWRGTPGGDVDQIGPEGGAAGFGVAEAGQGAGGAQQVVADRGEGEPGGVGREQAGGQVGERPAGPVSEHLFHEGVVAVLFFGLQRHKW